MVRSHKAGSCCHRRTSLHSQAHHAPSSATHHLESRHCTCKNSPCRKSITQLLRCDNNTTAIRATPTLRQCNYYYLTTMQLLLPYDNATTTTLRHCNYYYVATIAHFETASANILRTREQNVTRKKYHGSLFNSLNTKQTV